MPVIQKLIDAYKLWHEYIQHFPKSSRYTLGGKIDELFLLALELATTAQYLNKQEKLPWIIRSSAKLDLLKFFLRLAWETKALDNKKYITLLEKLDEIGRMLGGWMKQIQKESSA